MKGVTWMSGSSEEKKTYYRLIPCPAYDVEGMESWLEDLAEQGLFLTEDGFFCGFGFFEKGEPRKVKYRLQASEVQGGFLSDGDEPEEEQQELSEALGWEFLTRRGEFYIYRSMDENVRELNTDPAVQELSLKMIQKRQRGAVCSGFFWIVIFPLLRGSKNGLIVPMLYMKTWFYLFSALLVLWFVVSSVKEAVYYAGLRKKLKNGEELNRKKNWRKRAWTYPAKVVFLIVLCCTWCFVLLGNIGRDVLFEDEIPLTEYEGNPPFATMADFAPGGPYEPEKSSYFNTVVEWEDWLAPVNFLWDEYATVQIAEEQQLSGLLDIDYHELRWEWMAKLLAADYYRMDQKDDFKFLCEMDLGIDYAVAYLDNIHMVTVVLRHGNKVIHGSFHEYSYNQETTFNVEEWAAILAESLK